MTLDDDFFALGGDSILVLEVFARLESQISTLPRPTVIYQHRTVAALAEAIDSAVPRAHDQANGTSTDHAPRDAFPLSPTQRGFLLAEAVAPGSRSGWLACFRLQGPLDTDRFQRAVDALVERHLMLRVVFPAGARPPVQEELPTTVHLPVGYEVLSSPELLRGRIAVERLRLNCQGSGTTAQVVAGIDWVTNNAIKPAVANMSLGGGADTALDNAVKNSIASGVTYGIAAGNGNALGIGVDACGTSPARVPEAITVGATQIDDAKAGFSNFGTCLDIFGPGVNITSSWNTNDTATNTISGTSMATPHVVGVAALKLSTNTGFTPQQVRDALVADSTLGKVTSPGTGSPNRLLFVPNGTPGNTVTVNNPGNKTGTVGTATSLQITGSSSGGGALTYTATGLPPGLTISSAGLISGTPTTAGTYNVTVTGKDSTNATGSTSFTWTIAPVGGGCASPGQKLGNPGFETGSAPWTEPPA